MNEIWRPIPSYEGYYSASNTGKIRSEDRVVMDNRIKRVSLFKFGKILKPGIDTYGYEIVTLCKNGRKTRTVHQLILKTFFRDKKEGEEANHKDANKRNNYLGNLEWVTSKEHHRITQAQGRMRRGSDVNTSKLSKNQVLEIRERYRLKGISYAQLAREYGVKKSSIGKIIHRKVWKHI